MEELQENLVEKIQNLIDNSPYMIILIDKHGKVVNLNFRMLKFLCSEKKKILGKNYKDLKFFSQLKQSKLREINNIIFKSNISKSIEFKVYHPKYKKLLWLILKASILNLDTEEIIQVFIQDITQIKIREIELEKLKKRFEVSQEKLNNLDEELKKLMDRVPALIFYKDTKNNYIRVNEYVANAHGMRKEDLEGKSCFEIYPKNLAQKYWEDDLEVIKSGISKLNIIEQWETKEGLKWFLTSKRPYVKNNEKIIGIIGISTDITDRIIAEQKLRESEQKYKNLIETSAIGLMEIDLIKGGLLYINSRLLEIIGYSQDELKEENFLYRVVYPKDLSKVKKLIDHRDLEFRIITKEGKIKWLSGRILPKYNNDGKIISLRIWLQDITERKEIQEIKSNLLTRFSHEFKTPLISIKGFVDLMIETNKNLDHDTISFLKKIKEGASKLKILIDYFIESTQLNRQLIEINMSWENLSKIVKNCLTEIEGMVKLRNHTINLELHENLIVKCDRNKIYSVLINLLQNAIKFTPKGGNIFIQSQITKKSIIITIKDDGIGMQKDEITQLFKPFGKIEKYGRGWDIISDGMGMGLYYSKEIINLHKGKIWAESKGINKGSKFSFSLPIIDRNL